MEWGWGIRRELHRRARVASPPAAGLGALQPPDRKRPGPQHGALPPAAGSAPAGPHPPSGCCCCSRDPAAAAAGATADASGLNGSGPVAFATTGEAGAHACLSGCMSSGADQEGKRKRVRAARHSDENGNGMRKQGVKERPSCFDAGRPVRIGMGGQSHDDGQLYVQSRQSRAAHPVARSSLLRQRLCSSSGGGAPGSPLVVLQRRGLQLRQRGPRRPGGRPSSSCWRRPAA